MLAQTEETWNFWRAAELVRRRTPICQDNSGISIPFSSNWSNTPWYYIWFYFIWASKGFLSCSHSISIFKNMVFRNVLKYCHCQQNATFWISDICILWWKNTLLENGWLLLIASIHLLTWLPKCRRKWVCQGVHTLGLEFLWNVYPSQNLINDTDTCQVLITPAPWAHLPLAGGAPGELCTSKPVLVGLVQSGAMAHPADSSLEMLQSFHSIPKLQHWLDMLEKLSHFSAYPWALAAVCTATLQGNFSLCLLLRVSPCKLWCWSGSPPLYLQKDRHSLPNLKKCEFQA